MGTLVNAKNIISANNREYICKHEENSQAELDPVTSALQVHVSISLYTTFCNNEIY